jgi:glycosyltransferase involved in cell wall biosynthesis
MRILYVDFLGVRGGMGHYNEVLVAAYERAGASVELVTSSHDASYSLQAKVHVSRLFRLAVDRSKPRVLRAMGYSVGYLGCLRLARRADVVVMHFLHRPALDRWAIEAFRRLGCRLVLVAHDPHPVVPRQRDLAYQRCLRLFDLIVVHGPRARADIVAQGAPEDRVIVTPHGDSRPKPPPDPAAAYSALAIPNMARPTAAIIGNLRLDKGIKRARQALEAAPSPVRTLLVAGAKQGDWELDEALRTSEDSQLEVVRVDRRMSDFEERAAYSLADVILVLHQSGYSSGVIARAHSMGKPVVFTDVGDLAMQARPGDVVLTLDYTTDQLREAIERCLGADVEAPTEWGSEPWLFQARSVLAFLRQRSLGADDGSPP